MRKRENFFRPSVRDCNASDMRSIIRQNISHLLVAGGFALVIIVQASVGLAANDIQEIKLGPRTLFVPKTWMIGAGVTAFVRSGGMVQEPQANPIETDGGVSFRPSDYWALYSAHQLPEFIHVNYAPWRQSIQTGESKKTADRQLQKWMTEAARSIPDRYGFVRVEAYPGADQVPRWQVFVYQGSLRDRAGPLVVRSNSSDLMPGHRLPSFVGFISTGGLGGQFRFDNTKYPESTWWTLYQRVLAFVDYLQTPK
jgi:hypothetical protein